MAIESNFRAGLRGVVTLQVQDGLARYVGKRVGASGARFPLFLAKEDANKRLRQPLRCIARY